LFSIKTLKNIGGTSRDLNAKGAKSAKEERKELSDFLAILCVDSAPFAFNHFIPFKKAITFLTICLPPKVIEHSKPFQIPWSIPYLCSPYSNPGSCRGIEGMRVWRNW
jgi:hypothetical protein